MGDLDFCFDQLSSAHLGYPNLAQPNLAADEFDTTWPHVLPVRLFAYFAQVDLNHRTWSVHDAPIGSWYPIGLGWHDFACDYISLLPALTRLRVKAGEIKLLFYYHEGDNPARIKARIDQLCRNHGLPNHCYAFISANSAADEITDFVYFPDHELFFRYVNRNQREPSISVEPKPKDFTALNRTHKWWRATCMADLHRDGLLSDSDWSYRAVSPRSDSWHDNPVCLAALKDGTKCLWDFVRGVPYQCDALDEHQQNDHRLVNLEMYKRSYCHIVLETHFDADQSGGTFLTEKTYKCIKFGQPFVMIAPVGSIAALRQRGYRTFDAVIDHSYDSVVDSTQRWLAVKNTIKQIKSRLSSQWLSQCQSDLEWNQYHFNNSHGDLLNRLVTRLCQLKTGT